MNTNSTTFEPEPEEMFAEAVARLEAGEPVEAIVTAYPRQHQAELREMLAIVAAAAELQRSPVPPPSPEWQARSKREFLRAAAAMRTRSEAAPIVVSAPRRLASRSRSPLATYLERVVAAIQNFFTIRTLRLAPLIALLALVLLSTSTLVTMAQASVPGDLAYSFKQWIRKQELELAPAEVREAVRLAQERELAEDVRKAAAKADMNSAVIQAEDTQIYYGRSGRLLKIGGLMVMDRYQPDANVELFKPMEVEGELVPGAQVALVYQIMPGQSDTVQGIRLRVLDEPPAPVTPIAPDVPAVEDATDGDEAGACTVSPPEGWQPYNVKAGDNLTFLAQRGGVSIDELKAVNCLDSDTILIGATLYLPAQAVEQDGTGRYCGAAVPEGWVAYEVRLGDSLSVLAQRGETTISLLKEVNCLTSDTILLGSTLYVPAAAAESAP